MPKNILKELGGFIDPGSNIDPIRDDIVESVDNKVFKEVQAREVKQPDWIPPTLPKNEELDPADVFGLNIPDKFDIQPNDTVWNDAMLKKSTSEVVNKQTNVDQTKTNARSVHLSEVKEMENRERVGLETVNGVSKFLPIKSGEGTGPDKDIMSDLEIGYGIKIPKSWLTDDENNWPTVQGVKVDIRKGITDEQATAMSKEILDKSYNAAKKTVGKWDNLTEREKSFWGDLAYNGGSGALKKNKKAMAAAKAGHSVEAMIDVFHFIKSGGKHSRGLLNRRVSMYNQAALSVSGAPVASSYEVKDGIVYIQFSNGFMTDKVSKRMSDKITANKNRYILKAAIEDGSYKADQNYNYER